MVRVRVHVRVRVRVRVHVSVSVRPSVRYGADTEASSGDLAGLAQELGLALVLV